MSHRKVGSLRTAAALVPLRTAWWGGFCPLHSAPTLHFPVVLQLLLPFSHPCSRCPKLRNWFWQRFPNPVLGNVDAHQPEKAMAPHSSTLAWKIPWTEEPGRLQCMGSLRVRHDFTFTFTFHFHALEKEMATHSSVLAWRIPGTGEPGGLPSLGSHRVGHD